MKIETADGKEADGIEQGPFEPIAIIGIGALMPDAKNSDEFWKNIVDSKVSIKDVSEEGGPEISIVFGVQAAREISMKVSLIQKLEPLSRVLNLTGEDGDSLLVH